MSDLLQVIILLAVCFVLVFTLFVEKRGLRCGLCAVRAVRVLCVLSGGR